MWRGGEVIYTVRRMKDAGGAMLYRVQNNANLDVLLLNFTKEAKGICSPPIIVRTKRLEMFYLHFQICYFLSSFAFSYVLRISSR